MAKSTGGVASYLTSPQLAQGIPRKTAWFSQPTKYGMHTVCSKWISVKVINFSAGEQWAELYNDEELRLALEETVSPK